MESKEIGIKNRTGCYFDDVIGVTDRDCDFNLNNILLEEKSYKEKYEKDYRYKIIRFLFFKKM